MCSEDATRKLLPWNWGDYRIKQIQPRERDHSLTSRRAAAHWLPRAVRRPGGRLSDATRRRKVSDWRVAWRQPRPWPWPWRRRTTTTTTTPWSRWRSRSYRRRRAVRRGPCPCRPRWSVPCDCRWTWTRPSAGPPRPPSPLSACTVDTEQSQIADFDPGRARYHWAHSMGPQRSPLSRVIVVVVVVVDIARRLRYSYSWRATSDTWWLAM